MIMNMRLISFATVLQALVVFLAAVTQVQAGPLSLQRRKNLDVFVPRIIEPTASSVWSAGAVEQVVWDTSNAPSSISNQGHVVLKSAPIGDANPIWEHLAGPFNLTTGRVNVTVPSDMVTGQYKIILFGDSGNESDEFHLDGVEPSPEDEQSSDASDNSDPLGDDDSQTPSTEEDSTTKYPPVEKFIQKFKLAN